MTRAIQPTLLALLSAVALMGNALPGHAQPAKADGAQSSGVRATIVKIDGDDFLVDVGHTKVRTGTRLKVFRRIEVRHPVTKRKLVDRFEIGHLTVTQPGTVMSVARMEATPTHPFAVGDVAERPDATPAVVLPSAVPDPDATGAQRAELSEPQPQCPACEGEGGVDAETRELVLFWRAGLAQPPARRIKLYGDFLARHPSTEHRVFVQREIEYLRTTEAALERAGSGVVKAPLPARPRIRLGEITRATSGAPLWISAAYEVDNRPEALLLHARPLGEDRYDSATMQLDTTGHARVKVPQALIASPGFEFFIEAVGEDGKTVPVYASADTPHPVEVPTTAATPPDTRPSTRIRYQSEIVSFDGTSGRDYYFLNEGDFLYRVRYSLFYAMRMGYGHYLGEGGTVEELDEQKLEPRPAGFSYGFIEGQFTLSELFGLALRGTVGLGRPEDEDAPRDALTGGFQLRLRIGRQEGTQLELAGELLPEVGQRAFLQLRFEAIKNLPMRTEVHVTDQPVNSNELAVRLVYELGYRITDRIALAVRPSYQLRTIKHAGAGIGAAATFDW